jgi:hypothetical protein
MVEPLILVAVDIAYTKLIQIDGNLVSINISAEVNPFIIRLLAESNFPFAFDTYDNVICSNTLAQIHQGHRITLELLRMLWLGSDSL